MATTHHFHVRSDHVGIIRGPVIAAGVAAAACAVLAISSMGSPRETTVVDLGVEPAEVDALNLIEPVSALPDGRDASAAVQASVSGIQNPSILLDGAAFELAVNEAVAIRDQWISSAVRHRLRRCRGKAVTAATD